MLFVNAYSIQYVNTLKFYSLGILGGGGTEGGEVDDTPPTSPSRILKEGEGQWLNSEVNKLSLYNIMFILFNLIHIIN